MDNYTFSTQTHSVLVVAKIYPSTPNNVTLVNLAIFFTEQALTSVLMLKDVQFFFTEEKAIRDFNFVSFDTYLIKNRLKAL